MALNAPNNPVGAPASSGILVTPSDSAPLPFTSTALWVGGAGNLAVVMANQSGAGGPPLLAATTFCSVAAGQWMPIQVQYVLSTNTTATAIIAVKA